MNRYYRGFMMLYTTSLHHASFLMTNSTWTNAHVHSVLAYHPPPLLALLSSCVLYACPFLLGLKSMVRRAYTPLKRTTLTTRIVYPPCDTKALAEFSLAEREPIVLSIAQFRYAHISVIFVSPLTSFSDRRRTTRPSSARSPSSSSSIPTWLSRTSVSS
jgi:hypothetical protein